ncbi:IQ domain-containing protein E [Hyla sarda]|uniref:IQ domain-containing protein E n=1 Tax=Hyla sarda TaxID=327740 RepID=UPI0024C46A0E|nr:IQ domain-containing protein E [Hyla sarda]XP_056391929.1 IQ domain-containing protein E [Hyla sarda]
MSSWLSSENGTEAEELEDVYHELSQLGDDTVSAITYESDTDKIVKKKKSSKPPRSQNSPYLSSAKLNPKKAPVWRSLKGTGQMHSENPMMKVPRQLWLSSLKQGNGLTQPLKSDMDIGQAWVSPGSSTPEYLKEALGMKKPKYSRSASTGYIPGTPDFKEKEDMYDQIIDLKKMLQAQKSEADLMKTKLRRLEEENNRKDRQIEQLLDPSRSSEFARSLVDKKSDSSLIVNNLKQKILKLEKQCKEKDNALSKLQTELKTTSVEEMRIAMETYYEEIQRLQMLLAKAEAAQQSYRPPPESKDSLRRQKALNAAVLKLSKQVKELQEENKSLKADLDRAMAQSPTSTRSKGYSEWSKQRLVRKISDLEKKLESMQKSSTDQVKSAQVTGTPLSSQGDGPSVQKLDPQEECERLRNLVKKIKEDRAALQEQLATKEANLKKLQQEKTELEKQLQRLKERKDEREEINRLGQKIKRLEAELEDEKREKGAALESAKKAQKESRGSRPNSARSTSSTSSLRRSSGSFSEGESKRKQDAAKLIQKNWKLYKSRKEENSDLEETTVFLQAALRGHLTRHKMLSPAAASRARSPRSSSLTQQDSATSDSKDLQEASKDDDHVTFLQSTFRAHLTRNKMLEQRHNEMKGRESPIRKSPRSNTRSPVSRKSSGQNRHHSLASESSEEINEDFIEELVSEEEEEEKPKTKRPNSRTSLSQRSPSGKSHPPTEDPQSDDSDDIIVVSPSRPARRKDSDF